MAEKKRIYLNRPSEPQPEETPRGPRLIFKQRNGSAQPAPPARGRFHATLQQERGSGKPAVAAAVIVATVLVVIMAFALTRPSPLPPVPAPTVTHTPSQKPPERLWMKEYMQEHGDPEALKARKARISGQQAATAR